MKTLLVRALGAALLVSAVPFTSVAGASAGSGNIAATSTTIALGASLGPRLPGNVEIPTTGRFVLVDAGSAQLFMIEDGRVRDTMRVIVGKPSAATPTVKSTIYDATLNPYWHVPTDLARTIIAPRVLKDGASYLRERGYQVLSNFGEGAREIPASSVNWEAVAEGRDQVFVRQLPGPANSMGEMKFAFANSEGIYLHDTPRKELFNEPERKLSAGCVRLEDADRLASWLLGRDPAQASAAPEQKVPLPKPVPITITYLEAPARMQLAGL